MLIICPTPIGNLKDITLRTLEALKDCDYILCEDSRKTGFLLHHFQLSKKLVVFHKHNERKVEEAIIQDISLGKKICLVSDAGTPSINDPGAHLISLLHQKKLPVTSLPGPSSIPTALSLSGLEYNRFQFLGFFPKKLSEKTLLIDEILHYDGVSIFFESPHRIIDTLSLFPKKTTIYVAKELSKIHEGLFILTPEEVHLYTDSLTRGEFCLLIKGALRKKTLDFEDDLLMNVLTQSLSTKDAATIAAQLTGRKKQSFYKNSSLE
jgi:16S rRNA (cytidine1402-2'-O)-methyltransferase